MALKLSLMFAEHLDPWTREELQQLVAALQTQLGTAGNTGSTTGGESSQMVQLVNVTYASGATTAVANIPTPVVLGEAQFSIIGELFDNSACHENNYSTIDTAATSGSVIGVKRTSGIDGGANSIAGTVTVQIVHTRTSSI